MEALDVGTVVVEERRLFLDGETRDQIADALVERLGRIEIKRFVVGRRGGGHRTRRQRGAHNQERANYQNPSPGRHGEPLFSVLRKPRILQESHLAR